MDNDSNVALAFILFIPLAIAANEWGAPFLALASLIAMPIAVMVLNHTARDKKKR